MAAAGPALASAATAAPSVAVWQPVVPSELAAFLTAAGGVWCLRLASDACASHRQLVAATTTAGTAAPVAPPESAIVHAMELWRECMTLSWEKIHSGVWSEIETEWRVMYSFAVIGFVRLILLLPPSTKPQTAPALAASASSASATSRTVVHPPLAVSNSTHRLEVALTALDLAVLIGAGDGPYRAICELMISDIDKQLKSLIPLTAKAAGALGAAATAGASDTKSNTAVTAAAPSAGSSKAGVIAPADPVLRFPIARVRCPDLLTFQSQYLNTATPVILTGVIDHWPARKKWTDLAYLKEVAGRRTVPIEIGSHYLDDGWSQRLMTITSFIEQHIEQPNTATAATAAVADVKSTSSTPAVGYLAQHQLFEQIPALRADISTPDYCLMRPTPTDTVAASGEEDDDDSDPPPDVKLNAWFGPRGTVSPLHYDPEHNCLAQVVGRKYIRLYAESQSKFLYANSQHSIMKNTSQCAEIERAACDTEYARQFPLLSNAAYSECILAAGEVLYIPVRCWHYVRSLDVSFSVSFWWS